MGSSLYTSLQHELVVRNNQIYPYIKFKNTSKSESLRLIKNSFIWRYLENLTSFNSDEFIDKFDSNFLINLTNGFLKDVLYSEEVIDDVGDLNLFYQMFEKYFKSLSILWKDITFKEVDYIYESSSHSNEFDSIETVVMNHYMVIKKYEHR